MQELFFRLTNPNLSQYFSTNIIKFSNITFLLFKNFLQTQDLEKSLIVTKYLLHNFLTIENNLSKNNDTLEKK